MAIKFETDEKGPKVKRLLFKILIWFAEIGAVIFLAYFICAYCVEKTTVTGDSMKNVLYDGDKVMINKMAYHIGDPERFDVVVFRQNGKEHSYYNIKRIIGLPGETVLIQNGAVYIDGVKLEESLEYEDIHNGGLADEEVILDEKEYFVLGDNRNNSEDSRFANIGNILRSEIVGKAWVTLKPFAFINEITDNTPGDEEKQKE